MAPTCGSDWPHLTLKVRRGGRIVLRRRHSSLVGVNTQTADARCSAWKSATSEAEAIWTEFLRKADQARPARGCEAGDLPMRMKHQGRRLQGAQRHLAAAAGFTSHAQCACSCRKGRPDVSCPPSSPTAFAQGHA